MQKIDKNSFTPPFYQLATILEQKIYSGEWRPGASLPSETDLSREYELSRTTVRKCLGLLADRGLITAQQGRGTFVSRPSLDRATFVMEDFHRVVEQQGKVPEYRLVFANFLKQIPDVVSKLGMSASSRILYYCRLLLSDGEPIGVEHKYMLYIVGKPILENELQYKAFSEVIETHMEILPTRSRMELAAEGAGDLEARLLNISPGFPLIKLEQCLYSVEESPVGIGLFYYRGDRYSLISDIQPLKGER